MSHPKREAFYEFHRNNPDVYASLVRLARYAKERGKTKLGFRMLWEVLRWEMFTSTIQNDGDQYKLNNNYHYFYARLMMEQEPDLNGIFEIREVNRGENAPAHLL